MARMILRAAAAIAATTVLWSSVAGATQPPPGITQGIGGRVTSTTGSLENAPICISVFVRGSTTRVTYINPWPDGYYKIALAPGSRYQVRFDTCGYGTFKTQWYKGVASRTTAAPVTVTTGHVTPGISAVLVPSA